MIDTHDHHAVLEAQALELWESGALEDAAGKYAEAIAACSEGDWERGQYHSGRAGVLAALGRNDEARGEFELALAHALEHHGPTSPAVEASLTPGRAMLGGCMSAARSSAPSARAWWRARC